MLRRKGMNREERNLIGVKQSCSFYLSLRKQEE